MKTPLPVLAVTLSLLTTSCDRRREPYQPLVPKANAAELTVAPAVSPAIEKTVRERGDRIATEAFGVLSFRLGRAIADAGLTNAIEFCSVHGIAYDVDPDTLSRLGDRKDGKVIDSSDL